MLTITSASVSPILGHSPAASDTASILVVDDDPDVRQWLEDLLTRDGHLVVAAASGRAALRRSTAREFDLAVVDLQLPDMAGLEVLTALRQRHS